MNASQQTLVLVKVGPRCTSCSIQRRNNILLAENNKKKNVLPPSKIGKECQDRVLTACLQTLLALSWSFHRCKDKLPCLMSQVPHVQCSGTNNLPAEVQVSSGPKKMSKAPSAPFHNCQKQTYEIGRIICARTVKVEANQIPTPQPSPRLTSLRPKPLLHHEIGDSGTELFIHNLRKISKISTCCPTIAK